MVKVTGNGVPGAVGQDGVALVVRSELNSFLHKSIIHSAFSSPTVFGVGTHDRKSPRP